MDVQQILRFMDREYYAQREQNSAESKRRALAAARVHLIPETEISYDAPLDNNHRLHLVGAAAVTQEASVSQQ